MKKLRILLIVLFATIVLSAQGFEGFVKYKFTSEDGEEYFINYYQKGDMIRMEPEMADAPGAMIHKDGKTYVIMPTQKMYMELNYDSMMMGKDMGGKMDKSKTEDIEKPTKTGKTKEILGHTAEQWLFKDDNYTAEVWAATDLGSFSLMSMPGQAQRMPEWYQNLTGDNGFFPMLVEAKKSDGSPSGKMEAIEVNNKSVDKSKFEIPSDYQKLSMPGGN